jgi:hypothetical protein
LFVEKGHLFLRLVKSWIKIQTKATFKTSIQSYLNPARQKDYYLYGNKPKTFFNPGTENPNYQL